jgi:hypothetical protein
MPTQFLQLLLQAGKPVVVCVMKMREQDAPALVAHFQKEVVARMPPGVVGVLPIPFLKPEQLTDPARTASRYRIPLINQVAVLGNPPATARRRTAYGAARYLTQNYEHLLGVARQDLDALQAWQGFVQTGRTEFDQRYTREYLNSEKFRGFDEALVRLMELLELPGIGRVLSGVLWVVRTPYRWLRGLARKMMSRPEAPSRAEQPVLDDAYNGWIDALRKEAGRRADSHPVWAHLTQGFQSGTLTDQARQRFLAAMRSFQAGLAQEVDRTARALYEQLEKRPWLLNSLRAGKFALDVAAIGGTVAAVGFTGGVWGWDFLLVPVVASLTHQLVELLGWQVVDAQREQTRSRQEALLKEHLSGPMAEWLSEWPATGGSSLERLREALKRIPPAVAELDKRVRAAISDARKPADKDIRKPAAT